MKRPPGRRSRKAFNPRFYDNIRIVFDLQAGCPRWADQSEPQCPELPVEDRCPYHLLKEILDSEEKGLDSSQSSGA